MKESCDQLDAIPEVKMRVWKKASERAGTMRLHDGKQLGNSFLIKSSFNQRLSIVGGLNRLFY